VRTSHINARRCAGIVSNYENVERQQALENCDAEDMPSEMECVEADEDNAD
jgi:hypothetical protein